MQERESGVKKSLYIFLSAILGGMLFLILQRLGIFFYLMLIAVDPNVFGLGFNYIEFQAVDILTAFAAIILGMWYGIWLGLGWFQEVYERGSSRGMLHHIATHYWPRPRSVDGVEDRVGHLRERLADNLWQAEGPSEPVAVNLIGPAPIKRRVVRTRAPKKLIGSRRRAPKAAVEAELS